MICQDWSRGRFSENPTLKTYSSFHKAKERKWEREDKGVIQYAGAPQGERRLRISGYTEDRKRETVLVRDRGAIAVVTHFCVPLRSYFVHIEHISSWNPAKAVRNYPSHWFRISSQHWLMRSILSKELCPIQFRLINLCYFGSKAVTAMFERGNNGTVCWEKILDEVIVQKATTTNEWSRGWKDMEKAKGNNSTQNRR